MGPSDPHRPNPKFASRISDVLVQTVFCIQSGIGVLPEAENSLNAESTKLRGHRTVSLGVGNGHTYKNCRTIESRVQFVGPTARIKAVQVVLRKLGRGSRAVSGRLVRAPRKGSVVVIEFSDGMHEYVTTPVRRVLRLAARDVFYIETVNSRYRLEVRDREHMLDDASSG